MCDSEKKYQREEKREEEMTDKREGCEACRKEERDQSDRRSV